MDLLLSYSQCCDTVCNGMQKFRDQEINRVAKEDSDMRMRRQLQRLAREVVGNDKDSRAHRMLTLTTTVYYQAK